MHLRKGPADVKVFGTQLLRSGTSVAAHVREASRARSDAEFISKLGGALQETDESQLWLELLLEECKIPIEPSQSIHREAGEIIAIMTTIVKKIKNRES